METKKRPAIHGSVKAGTQNKNTDDINSIDNVQDNSTTSKMVGGGMSASAAELTDASGNTRPLLIGRVNSHSVDGDNIKTLTESQNSDQIEGEISVDWVQGTVPIEYLESLIVFISKLFDSEPVNRVYGRYRYNASYYWNLFDINIYYDSDIDKCNSLHAGRATIAIPATALKCLNKKHLYMLHHNLLFRFCFICTRYDIAFDDYSKTLSPSLIHEHAQRGNISGFRKCLYIPGRFEIGKPDSGEGDTCNLGTRGKNGSGKYLRFYDKEKESKGEICAYRMEAELSQDYSRQSFNIAATSKNASDMIKNISSILGGCVDFIDKESKPKEKNLNRFARLGWWEKIIQVIGRVKLRPAVKVKTIETAVHWMENTVAPTMAMLYRVAGPKGMYKWLRETIKEADKQLSVSHLQRIEIFVKNNY